MWWVGEGEVKSVFGCVLLVVADAGISSQGAIVYYSGVRHCLLDAPLLFVGSDYFVEN